MSTRAPRSVALLAVLALATLSLPALADDCSTAMLTTAQRAYRSETLGTDEHGKPKTVRMVQTLTTQYIQTLDGVWHSVDITVKDRVDATTDDLKTSKITCQRSGIDIMGGTPAIVYAMRRDSEGDVSDSKVWISANHLVLKVESTQSGGHYTTTYDYANVTPPPNAKPLGSH
jgi:hypothetical protein